MDKFKFEESLVKLQEACEKMKSPGISLEGAISCYEEGKVHYKICRDILENATQTIETFEESE